MEIQNSVNQVNPAASTMFKKHRNICQVKSFGAFLFLFVPLSQCLFPDPPFLKSRILEQGAVEAVENFNFFFNRIAFEKLQDIPFFDTLCYTCFV